MVEKQDSDFNSGSQDPYLMLDIDPGSSFDDIKKAKEQKILEAGEDLIKKAKIEAAYDRLLMVSLKARQLGNVSNEAVSASEKEKRNNNELGGKGTSLITRLKDFDFKSQDLKNGNVFPSFNIPFAQSLVIRISFGFLAFILILISPDESIELILSLSTIGLFFSQVRRGRKILPALGWSVVLLSIGLILGGLISSGTGLSYENILDLSTQKIESLPALVLIFLGIIFLE